MLFDLGLAVMKAFTLASLTVCPLPSEVPKVNVHFFPKNPVIITEAPSSALTAAMKKIPDSTAATHKDAYVLGLTEPKIFSGGTRVNLSTISDNEGNTCLAVAQVDMIIHYHPTIFVARELKDLPCRLGVVQMHEDQHVAFDREVMRDYIPKIKMEILWHLRSQGMQGPYTQAEVKQKAQEMVNAVQKSTEPVIEKIRAVRFKKQSSIDTIENYKAEALMCEEERPQLIKLLQELQK